MEERTEFPNSNINLEHESQKAWAGPFAFIQSADTQFGMIDNYINKSPNPNWDMEIKLTSSLITEINQLSPKPKFISICGDMLDAFPFGDTLERRNKQYQDFVQVFQNLDPGIKLICVCGNHDVGNEPTEDSVKLYRKQFGPDFFSFWIGGVKFVALNSQYFKSPHCVPGIKEEQEVFMESIPDPSAKHIVENILGVVFQHIPYFRRTVEEQNDYVIGPPHRVQILEKLGDSGVKYIFCGHYHRNVDGIYYKGIEQIITSAVGCHHYRHVCKNMDRAIARVRSIKRFLTPRAFINIFNAYVLPIVDYCCEIWLIHPGTKIDYMQNKVNRLILEYFMYNRFNKPKKRNTVPCILDIFKQFNIMKIEERLEWFMFKRVRNTLLGNEKCNVFYDWFKISQSQRGNPKLIIPSLISAKSRKSVKYRSCSFWNTVPSTIDILNDPLSDIRNWIIEKRNNLYVFY